MDKAKKAVQIAAEALYFNDRSDYKRALWSIVHLFYPNVQSNEQLREIFWEGEDE